MRECNIILFENFEILDAMGPAEIFGRADGMYTVRCFSLDGGLVMSSQGVAILTEPVSAIQKGGVLLVPGGMGVRTLVQDNLFLHWLKSAVQEASYVLSVCTGSALLAAVGVLDGRLATSNRLAFDWVESTAPKVCWKRNIRWVADGNIYTSAGVSAGMDMALGFLADRHGEALAVQTAERIEYSWDTSSLYGETR